MENIITFDKSAKDKILGIFGLTIDGDGYVVEKSNPKQKVLSPDGEEVLAERFAGIKKGSLLFFKSDLVSLIELADRLE